MPVYSNFLIIRISVLIYFVLVCRSVKLVNIQTSQSHIYEEAVAGMLVSLGGPNTTDGVRLQDTLTPYCLLTTSRPLHCWEKFFVCVR